MATAPPPWLNSEDAPVHCSYGSGLSCACVRFDNHYEALWTLDTSGLVACFTINENARPGCAEWRSHSRFRPVKGPIGIGFSGNSTRPLTTIMSSNSIHVHKAGGVSVFSAPIESQFQRKVQSFMSLEKSVVFTGESPTIGVANLEEPRATKYYSLDSTAYVAPNGGPASNNVNLQMCLPKTTEDAIVQPWLPIGIANGSVALCDHKNDFKTIGTTSRIFQTRVNAVRSVDNTIVAVNSLGNTTTVKIFDARKITECAMTINNIEGTLVDMDLFKNSYTGDIEMLMVTPQMFYVLSPNEPAPIYRSFQIDKQSITSCSATVNGKGSVIALTSGHFLTMRRVDPTAAPNAPAASFSNVTDKDGIFPPRHIAKSKWHISKNDVAAGFDAKEVKDPSKLFSAWPPEDYMILKVDEKHKAPAAFIRQVMETKDVVNIPQECEQLVLGRRVYAFPNTVALMRSDLYRPDPKDKISRLIPNPYPFNCEVGDDPSQVASLAIPKLKELRAKRTGRDSRYFCSETEEALQVCYPLQGSFDWKSWNALPKDIIGVDNTLPESWISPIVQCMYLVHGPHFPIRHAIVRHFCPRHNCVACELNIVFTNMITASNGEGCLPIVQLGALISVLKRRKEFIESKIFVPARNRDEMVGKLHLAQSLMLQCLDADFSAVVAGPSAANGNAKTQFPDLPEPPEMARIIKEYFGTQLDAQNPIDPILYWEMPPSAAKVEEGLTHVLKQVEYSRPRERIHIRALPPVLVILLNPDHGHLQPPPTLTFTRDKEEYSYSLCCQVHHLSDDVDDKGLFVSTHTWPKASARPDIAHTSTGGVRNDTVLINDYLVTAPMTGKQFETCIPPSASHSVALGYYSYDKFAQKSFTYARGAGVAQPPPPQLTYKDSRRHLLNTWNFLGPLMVHDTIADSIPQPKTSKYPPQRFIRSLDEVQPTDLIAIDAEYVIPVWGNQVEGFTRRPYYTLARVSCLVSSAAGDERVLIDDYIATDEDVKDYVSQYSGIHHGDLSPADSPYPLTSLKANHMKLRALLDRGCKFVGHGLAQDFRVCNIQVPQSQTIDTVELFAKTKAAGGRKFALRLLAATLLGETIQEDEHDSVEDARTALRLYRKYCELHASGQLEAFVDTVVCGGGTIDTPPRGTSPSTLGRGASPSTLAAGRSATPPVVTSPASVTSTTGATAGATATTATSAFGTASVVTTTTPPAGTTPSSGFASAAAAPAAAVNPRSAFANITPPTLSEKVVSPSSFPSKPAGTTATAEPSPAEDSTSSADANAAAVGANPSRMFPSKPATPPLAPSGL